MPDYETWILEKEENGIFWMKINRGTKRNAVNEIVIQEMSNILDEIKDDNNLRVLILTSVSDKFFSAGADIEMFLGLPNDDLLNAGSELSREAQKAFGKIEELPVPVIAAIKGLNLTAGLEITMCCDIILAAENAKFGQIETKYGITPGGGGTQRLTRLVGPLKARELIYTADIIDAKEAKKIGLVNDVFPLESIEDEAKQLAEKIIENSKRAVKESKFLIQKAIYINSVGFREENRVFGEDFYSREPHKRLGKFIQSKK